MRGSTTPVVLLLFALLAPAALAQTRVGARLGVNTGVDTNPGRLYGASARATAVTSLLGALNVRAMPRPLRVTGSYDLGGRKFWGLNSEDFVVQALAAEAAYVSGILALGVGGHVKDRRGGPRVYSDLSAGPLWEVAPSPWAFRLSGRARRFVYWPSFADSFGAGELGASARYAFTRRHSVQAGLEVSRRLYGVNAVGQGDVVLPTRRRDLALWASAGYVYRGGVALTADYGYLDQRSNSFGQAIVRHRLSASVGARTFLGLMVFAQGVLQLSRYPDGIYLSSDIELARDEDNFSSLTLKAVRPLTDQLELEARGTLQLDALPNNELHYQRQVAWLGLTWRVW